MSNRHKTARRDFLRQMAIAGVAAGIPFPEATGSAEQGTSAAGRQPEVAAIYCPLWHRYDHMDAWRGDGWTEWELVKSASPRFQGHAQPLQPSWGFFDESAPKWAEREIALAADHHIDVFLFDWYWYSGVRLMEEVLERAFLKASNRRRLKFALMWANHDWRDVFPARYDKPNHVWLPQRHSPQDLARVMDYCARQYFREPNYWTVGGRLFFSIFQPENFIRQLGGPAKTKECLALMDQRLHAAGLPSMHWNAMVFNIGSADRCQQAGFHSTTVYNITNAKKTSANLTQHYDDLIAAHEDYWKAAAASTLPHCPVVTMGWDVTPRCEHHVPFPFAKTKYPYGPVTIGNTPSRFGHLCRLAADFAARDPQRFAIFVNAWNEWTEGSYLLPEETHGDEYLKALQRALAREGR